MHCFYLLIFTAVLSACRPSHFEKLNRDREDAATYGAPAVGSASTSELADASRATNAAAREPMAPREPFDASLTATMTATELDAARSGSATAVEAGAERAAPEPNAPSEPPDASRTMLDLDASRGSATAVEVGAEVDRPVIEASVRPEYEASVPPQPVVPVTPPPSDPPVPECLNEVGDGVRCGCAADCSAVNALASCIDGRCVRSCDDDFGDCNGDLVLGESGDGCETELRTTDSSCGACGLKCTVALRAPYAACEDKRCMPLELTPTPLLALGRCLDVRGPDDRNGTAAQIWSCDDPLPQQQWAFTAAGELRGFANKCLDVRGPSDRNGTPVQIWDCMRVPQQRWSLNAQGQLVGLNGKCLQVVAGASADGQAVELWDCLDIPAQRWRTRP